MADDLRAENAEAKFAELAEVTKELLAENEGLRLQLTALTTALTERGTLGVLQAMAHDPKLPPSVRVKAAGLAVPFERPKLSIVGRTDVSVLGRALDAAHERDRRERAKPRLIEHDPPDPAA